MAKIANKTPDTYGDYLFYGAYICYIRNIYHRVFQVLIEAEMG